MQPVQQLLARPKPRELLCCCLSDDWKTRAPLGGRARFRLHNFSGLVETSTPLGASHHPPCPSSCHWLLERHTCKRVDGSPAPCSLHRNPARGPRPSHSLRGACHRCAARLGQVSTWSWTSLSRVPFRCVSAYLGRGQTCASPASRRVSLHTCSPFTGRDRLNAAVALQGAPRPHPLPLPSEEGSRCARSRGTLHTHPVPLSQPKLVPRLLLPRGDRSALLPAAT